MQRVEGGGLMLDEYLEWVVEQAFVLDMEEAGWQCLKADKLKRGWPDQILFGPGNRTVIVEFKKLGAKPRRGERMQLHFRNLFKAMDFEVHLVTGEEEAHALRDTLLKRGRPR